MQNRIEITEATLKEDRLILTVQSDEQIQKQKHQDKCLLILITLRSFTYLRLRSLYVSYFRRTYMGSIKRSNES